MKYRYHWLFKLTALVLAVISGGLLVLGGAGLVMGELDYYENNRRGQLYREVDSFCERAARAVFDHYAWKDTGIEPKLFERFFRWGADVDAVDELGYDFYYKISDTKTEAVLERTLPAGMDWEWSSEWIHDVRRGYVTEMPKAEYYPTYEEFSNHLDGRVYLDLTGKPLPLLGQGVTEIEYYVVSDDNSVNWQNIHTDSYCHADANGSDYTIYRMEYTGYDTYRVNVYMTAEQTAELLTTPLDQEFIPRFLKQYHDSFGPMAIWGGLVLMMSVLWLALTAGHSPKGEELRPGGLNRIPLDLWLAAAAVGCFALSGMVCEILDSMVWSSGWGGYDGDMIVDFYLHLGILALCGGGIGGVLALFLMAVAAQMKVGNGYWYKHTTLGLCWRYGWKWSKKAAKWFLNTGKKLIGGMLRFCRRFVGLLPLTWQWLLVSGIMWLVMIFCGIVGTWLWEPWLIILGVLVTIPPVVYAAYCFGRLRDAARKMSAGNLEEKIENRLLLGCFGDFAGHLNALGDTCIEAAKQQMKSERMKSELITNVSHDIKTPLTSIINYVDLLQKTDDEGERKEYLEVLDRQSQRLKKLIEDLMEMSRASSGNVAVEITPTDVGEAVNQALGEFADNLDRCGLTVLRRIPDEPCMALCDGRHLWRVLGNGLSNVVKYAMPGTRVYVDVEKRGQKVTVSLKNISANMLNVTAGELMERFVRGDASRNTEGNGLGLNIAKSLMELQGGRLDLFVDGDLFKVVLSLSAPGE